MTSAFWTLLMALFFFTSIQLFAKADTKNSGFLEKESSGVEFKIGALIQSDTIAQQKQNQSNLQLENQQDFRRARIITQLKALRTKLRIDYDFGISEGWRNVFLSWRGKNFELVIGQHTPPFSMENLNSSKSHVFLERSAANSLAPGMSLGVSLKRWSDRWSGAFGVYGRTIKQVQENDTRGSRAVTRLTLSPLDSRYINMHFGFNYQKKFLLDEETTRIRTRAGSRLFDQRLVDTRRIEGIKDKQSVGIEFALNTKHFRFQSEYINTLLISNEQNLLLNGGYIEAGVIWDSGSFSYSKKQGIIKPKLAKYGNPVEFAVRASRLDLEDNQINGGIQNEINCALSVSIKRNYKFSFVYSEIDAAPDRSGQNQRIRFTGLRLQYNR